MENTTTGKRIAKLREQKKLAEHLGISSPAVVAYEHDLSRPVRYMDKLALYFNVSVDYILCLSDNPQPQKQGLNDEEKKLLDQYWQLNTEGRLALNLYIDFLLTQENYTKKVTSA